MRFIVGAFGFLSFFQVSSIASMAGAVPGTVISGSFSLATDYMYHGVSQTGGTGAWQTDLLAMHESGIYAGAWASRIRDSSDPAVLAEADIYAGWRYSSGNWSFDAAADFVFYPTEAHPAQLDNAELLVSVTRHWGGYSLAASIGYSPSFSNDSGQWLSTTVHASIPITARLSADAGLGYQSTERPLSYGLPDYYDAELGLQYALSNITVRAAATWTSIERPACPDRRCDPRLTVSTTLRY